MTIRYTGPLFESLDDPISIIEWGQVHIPIEPVMVGGLVIESRGYCCVRVELRSGATGESYVLTRGLDVGAAVISQLMPQLRRGRSTYAAMRVAVRNAGWDGATSRAASAVFLAVADAHARTSGTQVGELLNGSSTSEPRSVVAVGYTPVAQPAMDAALDDMDEAIDLGADMVKVMGGFLPPPEEVQRLERAISRANDRCTVGVDLNGAWSASTCVEYLPKLEDIGVGLVEDPCPYELGVDGLSALHAIPRPPLACGEILASATDLAHLGRNPATDYLRPDATILGGISPFITAVTESKTEAHNPTIMPHFWPDYHRHLIRALPDEGYVEYVLRGGGGFGLEEFVNGTTMFGEPASDAPGWGFEIRWADLERLGAASGQVAIGENQ